MKKLILIFLFISGFLTLQAQQVLSVQDAINIALKNSYDIQVAANDASINKTNNTRGNAGMLPTVALTGSDNLSVINGHQETSAKVESNSSNARTNTLNAGIALNWTLYDGGKMFVTKQKLQEIESLGEIQYKDKVLQTVYNVIVAYYNVVKQKQQLASINEVNNYNIERVKILQTSFDAGNIAKTVLLQAKIDLNVNQENAVNQKDVIAVAKKSLNQLLCRDITTEFEVTDLIQTDYIPNVEELRQKLIASNTTILSLQKQVDIAKLTLKEMNTLRNPKFSLTTGYNFSRSDYTSYSLLNNRTLGPQIGGTLSIPLYQGGNANRQIQVSTIQLKSSQYGLENAKLAAYTQLANALTDFDAQRSLLKIEVDNNALAKENLDISIQRLRLGQTTSLEIRQAQESYQDSFTRLLNFEYNLKVSETKLKQLISAL
ncbi:MAG: TolC family protein [Bacteroidetes bacterium]|nr:TolC family protein [Bacteroidota bacterium]